MNDTMSKVNIGRISRTFSLKGFWCLHSYYSMSPYATDGSGRILIAGANPQTNIGEVLILSRTGEVLDRFGKQSVSASFWHTGFWQSWSPDCRYVYYQSGSELHPEVTRRELSAGKEIRLEGDMEGIPPSGEPGLSCLHGLLYAAGYGHPEGLYRPELAVVPFQQRDRHGIFSMDFERRVTKLLISTESIFQQHPLRQRFLDADETIKKRFGSQEGLTLMTYCIRWNRQGTRCLFYFGNHCVDSRRGEPRLASVFTSDRDLNKIHLAIDFSFEKRGVHWSWQPDGERLIGYGPDPDREGKMVLAEVRYDGTDYRVLSQHSSGGHPSVSPADNNLIVTDQRLEDGMGAVVFISRSSGQEIGRVTLSKYLDSHEAPGRNPRRICHHPVFSPDGRSVLCNSLPELAELVEISIT